MSKNKKFKIEVNITADDKKYLRRKKGVVKYSYGLFAEKLSELRIADQSLLDDISFIINDYIETYSGDFKDE